MNTFYTYHLRPGYGSDKLLLEFFINNPDSGFEKDLLDTLQEIRPNIEHVDDMWMNDEILLTISCDKGTFLYSKDIWGFAFIMAEQNQPCIIAIDAILNKSPLFQKEEVDYAIYKTPRN
ncbi:hypothetical protein SAMN05421788_10582 [Filimonas lacunae]|uniref:Uncharacterized protein n=1 Tax=Filimonas lacunae TaxID=477680 RepID=A0A173MD80_9BACT|nr:hypothetical protein [Filimonas lacunae]BAV05466.1 hypothetical protein FLA_1473 [Filimonas lacunae]SIT20959.1 hypothetical protein SAMN05421788_10582 [Filimonas lacunae]